MLQVVLPYAIGAFGLALLMNLVRLLRGPTLPDRILSLDTMYVNAMALLVLEGIRSGSPVYFEGALLIALLGFIGTVVLSKFILRGDVME